MKTSELEGAALDWAVAKAEVITLNSDDHEPIVTNNPNHPIGINYSGERTSCFEPWSPSEDWSQGGPIVARERIGLMFQVEGKHRDQWAASIQPRYRFVHYHPTPLIAAMRCFVASKLGDEVDVPEGLEAPKTKSQILREYAEQHGLPVHEFPLLGDEVDVPEEMK